MRDGVLLTSKAEVRKWCPFSWFEIPVGGERALVVIGRGAFAVHRNGVA